MPSHLIGDVRHGPLSDNERALIHAASTQAWTWQLTAALRRAVEQRGIPTMPYDAPGRLVEMLEEVGSR